MEWTAASDTRSTNAKACGGGGGVGNSTSPTAVTQRTAQHRASSSLFLTRADTTGSVFEQSASRRRRSSSNSSRQQPSVTHRTQRRTVAAAAHHPVINADLTSSVPSQVPADRRVFDTRLRPENRRRRKPRLWPHIRLVSKFFASRKQCWDVPSSGERLPATFDWREQMSRPLCVVNAVIARVRWLFARSSPRPDRPLNDSPLRPARLQY